MAYEQRRLLFDLSGTLAAPVLSTDNAITCRGSRPGVPNVFAVLPNDYSTARYTPLVIANDLTGKREVVWVVGHDSDSSTLTVERGREGTSRVDFDAGDIVRCAATLRDETMTVPAFAALPTDPHYGMVALVESSGLRYRFGPSGWTLETVQDPDRYQWTITNFSWPPNQTITPSGWVASGVQGSSAALIGNDLFLQKSGIWSLGLHISSTATVIGAHDGYFVSPNLPAVDVSSTKHLLQHRSYLDQGGRLDGWLTPPSFRYKVPASNLPSIGIRVAQLSNATINTNRLQLVAEFLGN